MNQSLIRIIRATVAYDGGGFVGSQLQKTGRTVLGEINKSLSKVLAHPVRVRASSRTDAGVHAIGMVVSFKTTSPRTCDEIRRAMNSMLPGDIRFTDVSEEGFDFHPRYSAIGKVYLYRILRAKQLPPMSRQYVLYVEEHKPFNFDLLTEIAGELEGEHDFRSFSPRLERGENPVKNVRKVLVKRSDPLVEVRFAGSGFLYQMVRRMMGLLLAIVQGKEKPDTLIDAITNPEKGKVRYNASPKGLFLEKVLYADEGFEKVLSELES